MLCVRRRGRGKLDGLPGLAEPKGCPFGHGDGGWVIHFPAVVCTSSPSTISSLRLTGSRSRCFSVLIDAHVGAHGIPGACAHGFPQVVGPW